MAPRPAIQMSLEALLFNASLAVFLACAALAVGLVRDFEVDWVAMGTPYFLGWFSKTPL